MLFDLTFQLTGSHNSKYLFLAKSGNNFQNPLSRNQFRNRIHQTLLTWKRAQSARAKSEGSCFGAPPANEISRICCTIISPFPKTKNALPHKFASITNFGIPDLNSLSSQKRTFQFICPTIYWAKVMIWSPKFREFYSISDKHLSWAIFRSRLLILNSSFRSHHIWMNKRNAC